jgi:hypothetical protein
MMYYTTLQANTTHASCICLQLRTLALRHPQPRSNHRQHPNVEDVSEEIITSFRVDQNPRVAEPSQSPRRQEYGESFAICFSLWCLLLPQEGKAQRGDARRHIATSNARCEQSV